MAEAARPADGRRDGGELRCPNPDCDQLIAHRYGAVIVPLGAAVKRERDGRIRLVCPSCGARVAVAHEQRAA